MSKADNKTIGVRVGVKSGGCAGMSYSMEYAQDKKKNDEVIEHKGVKVLIDPGKSFDKDLYALSEKQVKKVPTVCGSLREAMEALDKDRSFLTQGNVFAWNWNGF